MFVLAFTPNAYNQNLVNNPSFKLKPDCFYGSLVLNSVGFWKSNYITAGGGALSSSLDCPYTISGNPVYPYILNLGYQLPHTGRSIAVQRIADLRDPESFNMVVYLQNTLKQPLISGKQYLCGIYVSKCEEGTVAVNRYGFLLSTDTLPQYRDSVWIKTTPHYQTLDLLTDTTNWIFVGDTITAAENYTHITYGRFSELEAGDTLNIPVNYNYPGRTLPRYASGYFVDDAFVIPLDSLSAPDYGLRGGLVYNPWYCTMDYATVSVEESLPLVKYYWYNQFGQLIDTLNPAIHPRLTQDAWFVLKRVNPAGYSRLDTAYVVIHNTGCITTLPLVIKNNALFYPNPAQDHLTISLPDNEEVSIIINNLLGQLAFQNTYETASNKVSLSLKNMPEGIYFLTVIGKSSQIRITEKLIIER